MRFRDRSDRSLGGQEFEVQTRELVLYGQKLEVQKHESDVDEHLGLTLAGPGLSSFLEAATRSLT